ncbi:hypothetical protein ACLB2K_049806 [Fragaria x ananassa]
MDTEDDWSNSVRIFPTLKKNCYTIPVDKAGQRILVRASFYYWGFYDNKTSPTFELQFDGNYWATVNKPNIVSYEAIYIAKQNTTSICLARVEDDQIPFISALEIRSLHFNMYSHVNPNYALLLVNRIYGGANQTLSRLNGETIVQVLIDDKHYGQPVVPPFGSVAVAYITNTTASSNTNFSVQAADDSSIPTLINDYEVYSIAGPSAQGTKTKDVEGLTALQRGFDVLEKWSGDPCLPSSFAWELMGSMDLSDNRLNGSIPSSLSDNKNLKLVVSGNCLSGMSCSPASGSAPPSPGLQTPASGGPNQNPIHTPSSADKEFSGKLEIILLLGATSHFSLPFMSSF